MSRTSSYRNLPIKYKLRLLTLITGISALTFALGTVLAYYFVVLDSTRRDLTVLAKIFGSNSTAALSFNDPKAAEEQLSGLEAKRSILCAYLYTQEGQIFSGYRRGQEPGKPVLALPDHDKSWSEDGRIKIFHRISLGTQPAGAIYLESDLGEFYAQVKRFSGIVVIILIFAELVALMLSSKLQRSISQPVAHLGETAKLVSTGKNYAARAVKLADDDLGQLTDTFNEMLSEIESNRHSLERQVAARTVDLVAARDKAEAAGQAFRSSEERFRVAAENASDIVFEWDLRTDELQVFGTSAVGFGDWPAPRSFEEWKKTVDPEDLEGVLTDIAQSIQSGACYSGEYRVRGINGRTYRYFSRGQTMRDPGGEPYRWIGVATDITESNLAKEAIAQLAAIVQCSEDAIISTDFDGIITTWNGGAEKLLGYPAAEALGASLAILSQQPEDMREILDPSTRGMVSRLDEIVFLSKDGVEVPVSLTVSPIRNAGGQITGVATIARDISARKKAQTELAHQAQHDHLTGLPNRLLLTDRLAASIDRASRSGAMTAAIYVDLDGFKFVNDTLGHEAGDAMLQQATERLKTCIREPDTLARMGGDEFMLVVNELPDEQTALTIAERLRTALHKPFLVADHELYMTASIGISIYPRDGTDVSTLRQNADAAMYEAKRGGKDRVLFYSPAMRETFLEHLELETELRRALDRGQELSLAYQPIFDAQSGRQTAFEALLRWSHPVLGSIPPSKFIPLAEESGLIIRLGAWVLKEACRQCRLWQDRGLAAVRVAVNASALEFARPEFAGNVLRTLDEIGLPGELLEMELTETTLMHDMDEAISKMARLHERGVRISIDDFGTGYSSLGYLPRLPVDALKIDRSFVADLGVNSTALSLIEGMVSLAHSIRKRVVVEGVETQEQLELLRQIGADEIQGFLLGRPGALPAWNEPRNEEAVTAIFDAVEIPA
jgi:diguanylate cyclase (GGDEF)-like protein/PAS domain S-box-containing protein